jgi:hypothetical protein
MVLERLTQLGHLQLIAADVDAAEECDVAGHVENFAIRWYVERVTTSDVFNLICLSPGAATLGLIAYWGLGTAIPNPLTDLPAAQLDELHHKPDHGDHEGRHTQNQSHDVIGVHS